MDAADIEKDLTKIHYTEDQILAKLRELAARIEADYEGKDLLMVGVLRGAVMVMADLARSFSRHVEMDWMAISSYGSGTKSSGVVRIQKDLDTDITGRHVLIVEDIIDTGLTLSWLVSNLESRKPAALELCTAFVKPDAAKMRVAGQVRRPGTCRTSSWSVTAWTTRKSTATCAAWPRWRRTSTPDPAFKADFGDGLYNRSYCPLVTLVLCCLVRHETLGLVLPSQARHTRACRARRDGA